MSLTGAERKALNRQIKAARLKRIGPPPVKLAVVPPRKSGLEFLFSKGRITRPQAEAGKTYGTDYRLTQTSGQEPIKSCISGDVGGQSGSRILTSKAVTNVDAARRYELARALLAVSDGLPDIADAVCGKQLSPREVNPNQRKAAEIETRLKVALDILASHYRSLTLAKRQATKA